SQQSNRAVVGKDGGGVQRLDPFLQQAEGEDLSQEIGAQRLVGGPSQCAISHARTVGRDQEVKEVDPAQVGGTVGKTRPAKPFLGRRGGPELANFREVGQRVCNEPDVGALLKVPPVAKRRPRAPYRQTIQFGRPGFRHTCSPYTGASTFLVLGLAPPPSLEAPPLLIVSRCRL